MVHNKKITPSNPNMLDFDHVKRIGNSQGRKKTRDYYLDVASGKTIKMEELEKDQQDMQEKLSQVTEMVTSIVIGKWITDDPSLQRDPTSVKDDIDSSIVPIPSNLCEQRILRKEPFGRAKHVDMQQRCSLLDKKLKEIEGVDDLESVDPNELSLVPDVVIPPKFKMSKFEKYDRTKCPKNHLATYCNKMARHARNEDLLIYVFYESLTGVAAQWYRGLKRN